MTEWIVTKTVTEYHVFTLVADTEEEAWELAEDKDAYYCDSDNARNTFVETESVVECK